MVLVQLDCFTPVFVCLQPHSNLWAERTVKSVKLLIARNTCVRVSLDTDKMALALLQYQNMPDRDMGRSLAHVLFCQKLRDALPTCKEHLQVQLSIC